MSNRTARIDVAKADAKGLGIDETVTLAVTGKIKGLETYDLMDQPVAASDEKPKKKEPPRVTINLEIESVAVKEIKKKSSPEKAFADAYEKENKKEE